MKILKKDDVKTVMDAISRKDRLSGKREDINLQSLAQSLAQRRVESENESK